MADRFKKDWISAYHDGNENVNMEDLEKNYFHLKTGTLLTLTAIQL